MKLKPDSLTNISLSSFRRLSAAETKCEDEPTRHWRTHLLSQPGTSADRLLRPADSSCILGPSAALLQPSSDCERNAVVTRLQELHRSAPTARLRFSLLSSTTHICILFLDRSLSFSLFLDPTHPRHSFRIERRRSEDSP